MSQDVNSKLLQENERKNIIEELAEQAKVFTSLTEQEIFDLLNEKEDVVLKDWHESLVSMRQQ